MANWPKNSEARRTNLKPSGEYTYPNPAEVAEVHTPSVKGLMQRSAYSQEDVQAGERTYRNQILEWEGGRVYGLSTDLLVEALEWASGIELQRGRERLDHLRSHRRLKEREARETEGEG